jgi:predicted DsbA family dithiol-disulfide isomerase
MDGQQAGGQVSRIDVVSDAICPWCWVGKRNLDGALAILAAEGEHFAVHWRPYQLNPEMPREGVERAAYRAAKFGSLERSRDADARVAQAGAAAGLAFRHDLMQRTPNTIDAHRLIRMAGEAGCQDAVVERLFRAYFQEGRDVGAQAALAELAGEAGLDPAAVAAMLASPAHDACRLLGALASARGASAAHTAVTGWSAGFPLLTWGLNAAAVAGDAASLPARSRGK